MMIEEVPVLLVREAYVRLENQDAAAGTQDAKRLPQRRQHVVLREKMLEHVAREHDIDAFRGAPAKVLRGPAVNVDVGCSPRCDALIRIDRPLLAAPDVVHELAEAGAEIEN